MANWYQVTKRINNRLYLYWQRTERVAGRVKTFNQYIGPATGIFRGGPGGTSFMIKDDGTHLVPSQPDLSDEQMEAEKKVAEEFLTSTIANTNAFTPVTLPAAERREDERIRYGARTVRLQEQKAAVKKARRKATGTGASNPFLGQLLKAQKKPK